MKQIAGHEWRPPEMDDNSELGGMQLFENSWDMENLKLRLLFWGGRN
jgi:hypothetical protein